MMVHRSRPRRLIIVIRIHVYALHALRIPRDIFIFTPSDHQVVFERFYRAFAHDYKPIYIMFSICGFCAGRLVQVDCM